MTVENADRYLKLVAWLKRRYRDKKTGMITIDVGGRPSRYTRIETAAFLRYNAR